jgi:hypothetical protein
MQDYLRKAAKMLGYEDALNLPASLVIILNNANRILNLTGRSLKSYQAIAAIIISWECKYPTHAKTKKQTAKTSKTNKTFKDFKEEANKEPKEKEAY